MSLLPFGRGFSIHRQWRGHFSAVRSASRGVGAFRPRAEDQWRRSVRAPSGQTAGGNAGPERTHPSPRGKKKSLHAVDKFAVLLFGEILRRAASGGPPQDERSIEGPCWTMKDRWAAMGSGGEALRSERPHSTAGPQGSHRTGRNGISASTRCSRQHPHAAGSRPRAARRPDANRARSTTPSRARSRR